MKIDDLTISQAREIAAIFSTTTPAVHQPYRIGENYLIRTGTHIDVGTVVSVGPQEIVLVNASWIADTGRYANAIAEGTLSEVEPYPDGQEVIVGRNFVVDATLWNHPLPRKQK